MHLSMSRPTPLPRGLTYFYRGFDSEYFPNPGDIDIFFQQPIIAICPLHFILSGKNTESKHSVGLIVAYIRWRPIKILFMLVKPHIDGWGTPISVGGNIVGDKIHLAPIHGALTPISLSNPRPLYPREGGGA